LIDVGGGTSSLAAHLVDRGFVGVSVLDLSATALAEARSRLGEGVSVHWLQEDLLVWRPQRRYDLWHDRAVFHFLVNPLDRDAYLQTLRAALRPKGCVVIATFASDGPRFCSGRPVLGYAAADLARLLGPEFEQVETRREEHTTPTGVVQPFTWVAGRMRPG
jgi:SAM-dependent methyltransferase